MSLTRMINNPGCRNSALTRSEYAGAFHLSNTVTDLRERFHDTFPLIPLNLDGLSRNRSAGSADVFQLGQEHREIVRIGCQSLNQGDDFSFLPFFDGQSCRLLARLDDGPNDFKGWTLALGFGEITSLAVGRSIENRS